MSPLNRALALTLCCLLIFFACRRTLDLVTLPFLKRPLAELGTRCFPTLTLRSLVVCFPSVLNVSFLRTSFKKLSKKSDDWFSLRATLNNHLRRQESCCHLYHSWCHESVMSSSEFMCIIHDCMDTSKTALPRLRVQNKMISGLGQLPVNLTRMVTHGHGDGAYAHYSNELWPNDSNFTVSSLALLLRTLERPPFKDSKVLFEHPLHNDFFCKLLRGKSRCLEASPCYWTSHCAAQVSL